MPSEDSEHIVADIHESGDCVFSRGLHIRIQGVLASDLEDSLLNILLQVMGLDA